jgi:hypothetical protein
LILACLLISNCCDNTASWKKAQKIAKKALANSNVDSSGEEPDDLQTARQAKRPRIKSSLAEFPEYSETEADSKFYAIKHIL